MYCSKCGKEIPEESKFCPECGFDLLGQSMRVEHSDQTVPEETISPPKTISPLSVLAFVFSFLGPFCIIGIILGSIEVFIDKKRKSTHILSYIGIVIGSIMFIYLIATCINTI